MVLRRHRLLGAGLVAAAIAAVCSPVAQGTYLGDNGKITFDVYQSDNSSDVYAVDPDGSNTTLLIDGGRYSAWSPDGSRIAYTCTGDDAFYDNTCTAAANGSDDAVLDGSGTPVTQYRPFWSPDGQRLIVDDRITFGHNPEEMYADVWRIDAADGGDPIRMATYGLSGSWSPNGRIAYYEFREHFSGTDRWVSTVDATTPNSGVRLTESGQDAWPDWSPDATKIVFESYRQDGEGIYVMNADGSSETRISDFGFRPVWSPDGTKILFATFSDLWVMNADGTGQVNLTNTPTVYESDPAWQPVPQMQYARPKGASPIRASLVPAYLPCDAPNRMHGPPLAFGSCAPPGERAGFMTFGSAPVGTSPKAIGHVLLKAIPGGPEPADTADVEISVNLTDVRRGFDLADGPGSLELPVPLRLTDKDTAGPFAPEQGTVQDFNYFNNPVRVLVPCAETADPTIGSTCSVNTSADALTPSAGVREGARAIWQLDQIAVYDGGEDGFIDSRDDNTVLAVQGVFVP